VNGRVTVHTLSFVSNLRQRSEIPIELAELTGAILNYLDGVENRPLSDLISFSLKAISPFTRDVYTAARAVPYGKTITYKELAARSGHPAAVRAVASALRKNPLPLIIPCHRIISASGIGGFMGETEGEAISLKKRLIALEAKFSMI